MKTEPKKWLEHALSDLDDASYLLDGKRHRSASFFSQQAAEKALKAMLLLAQKAFRKTHDLVSLGKEAGLPPRLLAKCERLNMVYVDTRYPDTGDEEYTAAESREDIATAKEVVEWTKKKIS